MGNEVVLYEKEERVGLITINRPEVRNALNNTVFLKLSAILDQVAGDEDVRSLVITGSGTTFVAGADINELLAHDTLNGWAASRFSQEVFNKVERLGKPSVAAMNGAALGGGLELALACTLRVASGESKMGFPELSLGIIPGFGGTQRIVRSVGYARASELLLRSSILGAEEAQRIGLINYVVPQGETLDTAKGIAKSLAMLSPVVVRLTMELLRYGQNEGFDTGLAMESALATLTLSSKEAKELLGKFLSKGKDK
jgi:enoyl-CoA hydratase